MKMKPTNLDKTSASCSNWPTFKCSGKAGHLLYTAIGYLIKSYLQYYLCSKSSLFHYKEEYFSSCKGLISRLVSYSVTPTAKLRKRIGCYFWQFNPVFG